MSRLSPPSRSLGNCPRIPIAGFCSLPSLEPIYTQNNQDAIKKITSVSHLFKLLPPGKRWRGIRSRTCQQLPSSHQTCTFSRTEIHSPHYFVLMLHPVVLCCCLLYCVTPSCCRSVLSCLFFFLLLLKVRAALNS